MPDPSILTFKPVFEAYKTCFWNQSLFSERTLQSFKCFSHVLLIWIMICPHSAASGFTSRIYFFLVTPMKLKLFTAAVFTLSPTPCLFKGNTFAMVTHYMVNKLAKILSPAHLTWTDGERANMPKYLLSVNSVWVPSCLVRHKNRIKDA